MEGVEGRTEPDTEPVLERQDYVRPGEAAGDPVLVGLPKGDFVAVEFGFRVTSTGRWILRTRGANAPRNSEPNRETGYDDNARQGITWGGFPWQGGYG